MTLFLLMLGPKDVEVRGPIILHEPYRLQLFVDTGQVVINALLGALFLTVHIMFHLKE